MSLMPMRNSGYSNTPDEVIGLYQQRKLADVLRQQSMQQDQGQMVGGHYVSPSWTQGLAKILQAGTAGYLEQDAQKKQGDYNENKRKAFADILSGNKPQQIAGAPVTTSTMPAYTPEQQDQFGSPLQGVQRQPVETTTTPMTQETPEQQMQRVQPQVLDYMQKYGATPEGQYLLNQLGKQDDRAYAHGEKVDDRNYAKGEKLDDRSFNVANEEKLYNRGRADKLSDTDAERKYQDIVRKDTQGFQLTQQDRQFAQQFQMQKQSQGFQAGQQARSQAFQSSENQKNRDIKDLTPTAVLGNDGKPIFVAKSEAIGKRPYSAAQEAKDALKVTQNEQSRISAQQVLDQADLLFNHAGRKAGTGLSHYSSLIPATDAKDFKVNLDTFKAQTFIPMVSALKGMGALSDAEGKKLTDSVGALDPSMSEEAFANSLKTVTKTLYSKAKANGLDVTLPSFAQQREGDKQNNVGSTGGWSITPVNQ